MWSATLQNSEKLLNAIFEKNEGLVAEAIQEAHEKNVSIIQYNDENSLACVLRLALYIAQEYYTIVREFPSGKGFADLVFIPRKKFAGKPAMIVELKWDKSAQSGIDQIKERNYAGALKDYQGELLLVGINYDKSSKTHECLIEETVAKR